MKMLLLVLMLVSEVALAAPPIVTPSGLTPGQIIAHRQGVDIGARNATSQNVVGSRGDEYSVLNPGSGQARSLFNSTVMNAGNQATSQPGFTVGNGLSTAYKGYVQDIKNQGSIVEGSPKPFASKVGASRIQGMIFLKRNPISSEQSTASPNTSQPPVDIHGSKNLQIIGGGAHNVTIID